MSRKIMALIFLAVLYFPMLDTVFEIVPKANLVEKRRLAAKPDFGRVPVSHYPRQFTAYYTDHFPFRGYLIYLNSLLKFKLFGISAAPRVLVGKQGWLFMEKMDTDPGTVDYYRSQTLFSRRELEQWNHVLEERRRRLAARGIHYLFVIAPNKNTIYPEYMPDRIRKARNYSRMDQLLSYLRKKSLVPVLDLRKALVKAKKHHPVYSRTDTHWNGYGAYVASTQREDYDDSAYKGNLDTQEVTASKDESK